MTTDQQQAPTWSPWRAVVGFGVVSLAADMVYEGARSITGPLLASLGASAVLVGLVTGAGETAALVLRLVFGSLADRTRHYWGLTLIGYALTAICVPLLAVTPFVGGAGLALACTLVIAERTGKAIRSPSKSTLLAHAAAPIGLGRGLGVHKALDQVGAFAGPLLVAGLIAATAAIWPALAFLAVPGAVAIGLLLWLRGRLGEPVIKTSEPVRVVRGRRSRIPLPARFYWFAAAAGATTAGLVTFGIISFHLVREQVVATPAVPVIYAAAMATEAVAALATGWAFDHVHGRVLLLLPLLVAAVPALAFSNHLTTALIGILVWGAAGGIQDSTVKALVAQLVAPDRRATAYGVFAAIQGAAALLGGGLAGALYSRSIPALIAVIAATQVVALALLMITLRRSDRPNRAS
ncbi:MFS transporter [Microlunatus panaciterrae]|uniref:MFS family permease n=1 Tax=Microlunatus panaciterrae TaxID=400768 RepID=A0ABS2RLB3_9ACTN|nr:MFS transporter [Microlunatus panaciterrae]MBM7799282.1 MFS family permease [Microlunatus panaciterrae]